MKLRLPQAVNELPEHLCSAQDGGFVHGWEITLMGGGPYTRVCNLKVMVDYPHTQYDYSGFALTDVSNVVVKVYHLCRG